MIFRPILTAIAAGILCCFPALGDETSSPIGKQIEPFTLDNCYGKQVSLDDFADKDAIAIVFLGTECPLAKLYGPRLQELQAEFDQDNKKVAIIGVNSNAQDSMTELKLYRERHEMKTVPMLKDVGNRVADALGAERTPEVFLLDRNFVVRYHGQIDGQYLVGTTLARFGDTHKYLKNAVTQLLAGETISVPVTEAEGCFIGRTRKSGPTGDITYTKHIAPIFNEHCVQCHREQEIAPFTLTSYEDIQGWEDTILEVIDVQENDEGEVSPPRMPPWFADPKHGKFANDARLSETEKNLIFDWVENGMPEGDPADLPEPPEFTLGWQIPEPDQVFRVSDGVVEGANEEWDADNYIYRRLHFNRKAIDADVVDMGYTVPAENTIDYQYCVVDPKWKEDKYVYAAEARPDNRSVVHHIIAYVIPPADSKEQDVDIKKMLAGYAPGALPMTLPEGAAVNVPAGHRLLIEMHYTPNGKEQVDNSVVGLCFMDKADVKREAGLLVCGAPRKDLLIPAGVLHEDDPRSTTVEEDTLLLSMTPHMHLRGKSFKFEAITPGNKAKTLLDVPNYDFNWQLKYTLRQPILLKKGTIIQCTAWFDNTEKNKSNPNPQKVVRWGDQSDEEMMIGFMETVSPIPEDYKKTTSKATSNEVSRR